MPYVRLIRVYRGCIDRLNILCCVQDRGDERQPLRVGYALHRRGWRMNALRDIFGLYCAQCRVR
ncbi:MAG: hypothetical protein GF333_08065 [Candidatus Omnitrophica bacterium]|nr:hypothetical protein [Candidatus Omnitrophota bacterium]